PVPRLPGRADQRHAGGRHARHPQPDRGPHLRVARPAHPVRLMATVTERVVRVEEAPVVISRSRALATALKRKPLGAASAGLIVMIVLMAILSVLRPNTTNAMLAIAIVIIPGNSRIVRGAVMSAKQNRYVEAAQAIGCRHPRIILSHILPNVTAPILVIASIWLGNAILIEATLSFLGVGTQPPTP